MPFDTLTEEKTLRQLKNGCDKSFESIFYKYNAKVYNFVLSVLYDRTLAEDITQSVFLSVWENRSQIDETRNFQAWLFTIARNMVYRHTEKLILNLKYETYIKENFTEAVSSVDEHVDHIFLERLIMDLVRQLPEARRKIFLLKIQKQLTNKEIAEELSISEKTVETQLTRSLTFLRKQLKGYITFLLLLNLLS